MWVDIAQEVEPEPEARSDDEDTVYDRNSEFRRNPFADNGRERSRMLEEGDTRCGIWGWRPEWLQKLVSQNSFITAFVLSGVLNGASWSYFSASITTMEKRLKISSETTGALLAGSEVVQLIISVVFSYFAIRKKRMKWITLGASLWALACFILASHQIFFGSGSYALSLTKDEKQDASDPNSESEGNRVTPTTLRCLRDVELFNETQPECSMGDSGSSFPVSFVLLSQILLGAGTMLFLSSGGPYVEDVVMPDELPVLFAITLSLRMMGPFVGFVFGSGFLGYFISSSSTPAIEDHDPRWMGAWWLGWLILGIMTAIMAFLMSLFPAQMARNSLRNRSLTTDTGPALLSLNSFAVQINSAELKVSNPIPLVHNLTKSILIFFDHSFNLYITLSTIFAVFVGIGYWTFFPKYLEVIFHEPAAKASMLTGSVTVTFNAAGLLVSGIVISKLLPNAERVSQWNVLITLLQIVTLLIVTQFGCETGDIIATEYDNTELTSTTFSPISEPIFTTKSLMTQEAMLNNATSFANETGNATLLISTTTKMPFTKKPQIFLLSNCSKGCDCKLGSMAPMCDESTGQVFYSPCHAGCTTVRYSSENGTEYSDCSCLADNATLTKGFCSGYEGCYKGMVTLLVFTAISQFLGSTGVIGRMLIFYRGTMSDLRSHVISISVLLISIFAIIPGPIIFGSIIDAACSIWEHTCDRTLGHCWHYDHKVLRYGFNLAAAGLLVCGLIFDILLWRKVKVKDVRLYDGDIQQIPKPSPGQPFQDMSGARENPSAFT